MLDAREITESLPPAHDDEPSSLRQEIVDEIVDHLQCGLRRELLINGGDEISARQRVLNSFGDPQQIARKLWYQAMWSKIMTQRLIVGSTIVSMAVSMALVVMMGLVVQQMGLQYREQQQANAALIERMSRLITQPIVPQTSRDPRWNNLKVHVTTDTEDGPPAEGYEVRVSKKPIIGEAAAPGRSQHIGKIDETGMADCGHVEPGVYDITILTPWQEQTTTTLTIPPGSDHIEHIVAPLGRRDPAGVEIDVSGMPDNLTAVPLAILIRFRPTGSRNIANRVWKSAWTGSSNWVDNSMPSLLLAPGYGVWVSDFTDDPSAAVGIHPGEIFEAASKVAQDAKWTKLNSSRVFSLPTNRYSVEFALIRLTGSERLEAEPDKTDWSMSVGPDSPKWPDHVDTHRTGPYPWTHAPFEFVAALGKRNEWTIALPSDVIEYLEVRNALDLQQLRLQPRPRRGRTSNR